MSDFCLDNVTQMMVKFLDLFEDNFNIKFHCVLVKDKAEKPFALAFLPLIEKAGTVIQDGHRHLVVYKVCIEFTYTRNNIELFRSHNVNLKLIYQII